MDCKAYFWNIIVTWNFWFLLSQINLFYKIISLVRTLRKWKESAEDISEEPLPGERLERREGYCEEAHDDVGHGQVEDEEVGHRVHVPVTNDHDRHEEVPEKSEAENDRVQKRKAELDRQSAEINLKNKILAFSIFCSDFELN